MNATPPGQGQKDFKAHVWPQYKERVKASSPSPAELDDIACDMMHAFREQYALEPDDSPSPWTPGPPTAPPAPPPQVPSYVPLKRLETDDSPPQAGDALAWIDDARADEGLPEGYTSHLDLLIQLAGAPLPEPVQRPKLPDDYACAVLQELAGTVNRVHKIRGNVACPDNVTGIHGIFAINQRPRLRILCQFTE